MITGGDEMKKDGIVRDEIDRGRRNFLKILSPTGAGMAVGGCRQLSTAGRKRLP